MNFLAALPNARRGGRVFPTKPCVAMPFDFVDKPPTLDNQYDTDRVLQSYVRRHFPENRQRTGDLATVRPKARRQQPNRQSGTGAGTS